MAIAYFLKIEFIKEYYMKVYEGYVWLLITAKFTRTKSVKQFSDDGGKLSTVVEKVGWCEADLSGHWDMCLNISSEIHI